MSGPMTLPLRILSMVELRPSRFVLTINSLARELGASRAAVMQAARQLVDEGAVGAVRREGAGDSLLGVTRIAGAGR